ARLALLGGERRKTKTNCRAFAAAAWQWVGLAGGVTGPGTGPDLPRAGRPRAHSGTDFWSRPVAGHARLAHRAQDRRSHAEEPLANSVAPRPVPTFLAGPHPGPRRGQ